MIELRQTPAFRRAYKKLRENERKEVNKAIRQIADSPEIGELKTDDLAGIRVYKLRVYEECLLLAYEYDGNTVVLLMALGVPENFYRDLKNSP